LSDQQIASELDTFVGRLTQADVFSGVVALSRDGRVVFQNAYGLADKNFSVQATLDTKYNIASMGKMFTAVAVAQLVEQGKLSYEDPLSKFIRDFPNPQAAQKIRIKHLLSHSAGLGMWWGPRYATTIMEFRTVDDLLRWAATDEKDVLFEPGTKFQYSNTGYVVLGKVIEVITGQSYFDYVREHIYRPAGMMNTDAFESEPIAQRLAVGYDRRFDANGDILLRSNLGNQRGPLRGSPAGGSYSTAEDLLRFSQALRSGKLLRPESHDLLMSPKPEFHSKAYGYGFDVDESRHTAGHGGGTVGASNNFEMFLDSGWTAVVLCNTTVGGMFESSAPVVEKMRELILASESRQRAQEP
jgi:CubicO group peptidase (beta-lactamase class C family)